MSRPSDAGWIAYPSGSEADFEDHSTRMFDWYSTHFAEVIEDRPITEGSAQR